MAARVVRPNYRREAGNPAVEMIDDLHNSVANPVSASCQQYLRIDCAVADLPDFLIDSFYIINTRASNENLRAHLEEEEALAENEIDPDGSFEVPAEYQFRRLLSLVTTSKGARGSALMIATAIMTICDENFGLDTETILGQLNMRVERCDLDDFITVMKIDTNRHNEIEHLKGLNVAHYVLAASMLVNLIGKNVNATNYAEWKQRRIRSYSAPLMLATNDANAIRVIPTLQFAMAFYAEVRSYWQIRRRFFIEAWALSRQNNTLAIGMRIAVNLLRGAEMTNLSMILLWVATLNPDLLFWNELGKYLPFLYAAYTRYRSFNQYGDWAKLMVPPEDLKEFSSEKLQVLYTVARAISQHYGNVSASFIEGTNQADGTKEIVRQALNIVKIAGGARTIDVMALRAWRYNGYSNEKLSAELDTGAGERLVEIRAHDGVQEDDRRIGREA